VSSSLNFKEDFLPLKQWRVCRAEFRNVFLCYVSVDEKELGINKPGIHWLISPANTSYI
jgi:hypothetical protein